MRKLLSNFLRKHIGPYRSSKAAHWRWFFLSVSTLESIASKVRLAFDHLLFRFSRKKVNLLFPGNTIPNFEISFINLLRRPDKRQFIEEQFSNAGFDVKMFPAIDGTAIDQEKLTADGVISPDAYLPPDLGKIRIPAQIGVYLSHYELWKSVLDSSAPISLILEDDALLVSDGEKLRNIVGHIPDDTDLFFVNSRDRKKKHITPYVSRFAGRVWGATAYFITKKGAEKLVSAALPINRTLDVWISDLSTNGEINLYCSREELIVECSDPRNKNNYRFSSDIIQRPVK